jgi:ApaG protein
MEGTYRFVCDDGSSFLAAIPRFTLAAEPRADTVS